MIEVTGYACTNWVITPAALALNESPPVSIRDQKFLLVLSGVAFVNEFRGENFVHWRPEKAHIRPPLDAPLGWAVARHQIPTPPGEAGRNYTLQFQVEQHAIVAAPNSTHDSWRRAGSGSAVDAWRPLPFNTMTDAVTQAPLGSLFAGIQVDIAIMGKDALLHRVSYGITLVGRIVYAAVIVT